jgi:prephenate dehydrogenase
VNEPGPFSLAGARVAIVGLGLMGGSLAAALKARGACRQVVGVARRPQTLARALELGYVDEGHVDLAAGVADADIVVLATPVRAILQALPALAAHLAPGALVTDLGSTKARIAEAMAALPASVHACPAHPMCGKEAAGLEAADPDLYAGQVYAICPLPRTRPEALALVEALARAVGARPLRLDPARHDRLVAATSHLPYLLAVALTTTAEELGREDPSLWELAASGFRDTSRLAASNAAMMLDVLLTNPGAIAGAIARCRGQLDAIERLLRAGDEPALGATLEAAAARRGGLPISAPRPEAEG